MFKGFSINVRQCSRVFKDFSTVVKGFKDCSKVFPRVCQGFAKGCSKALQSCSRAVQGLFKGFQVFLGFLLRCQLTEMTVCPSYGSCPQDDPETSPG